MAIAIRRKPTGPRPLSLALQGGGAHGAFEWGVIERLLEDDRLEIKAVTAASAGAMNAAALAWGMIEGGREGDKARLESYWRARELTAEPSTASRTADSGPARSAPTG